MVMSATLDMPKLSEMLNAEVVLSEGRQYPVQVLYAGDSDEKGSDIVCAIPAAIAIKVFPDPAFPTRVIRERFLSINISSAKACSLFLAFTPHTPFLLKSLIL